MINNIQTISKEWRCLCLSEVADIVMGQSPSSTSYNLVGDGLPFFQGKADFKTGSKYPVIRQWTNAPTKISDVGDVLFTVRAPVGDLAINNIKSCIGRGLASLRAKGQNNQTYLFYILQSLKNEFEKKSQGSTFTAVNKNDLANIKIFLPPVKEQNKIAEILSSVDDEIEKVEQVIKKTEDLKNGLMAELFSRGIGHIKFKKTKIGEVPEEWAVEKFEDFATLQRGFDLPIQNRVFGEYLLVTSNGITSNHSEAKVKAPGVVTGRSGTLGNVFFIENDFWPLNTTLYIKDFHDNDPKFVYFKLQFFDLGRFGTGTGVPTLNRNIVHAKLVATPKYREQRKIADVISEVDNKIDINKKIKNKLTVLKNGLMQDLLIGKVRVSI